MAKNPYSQLISDIRHYESDTFSASGHKLGKKRAGEIAAKFIEFAVRNLMDGDLLVAFYQETSAEWKRDRKRAFLEVTGQIDADS